ncbi:unnamed protein product [Rotaria sordida]|uniref:Uncharacterized protein n=1 Tax=Rotaria sordida TaxID=392033 RepID=A0A819DHP8_9BILA|nr:unnamed protein product [Rotaria sordida]CAF1288100.1 unnamed protein product [Rotaria sordida]CAF3723741.1 unnamed protein product [Rotaria sordida]CAF3838550.1 unnamed protein product [Rotaria sordida]
MSSTKHIRRIIKTTTGGRSNAPYSQAVQIDQMLYLSGAVGLDPETGKFAGDTIQDQTRQTLKNLGEVLKAAGVSYKNVIKVNVFLQDMNDFSAMNAVYTEVFSERHPARSTVQVAGLPLNAKVEIEAVAVMGDIEDQ